MSKRKFEEILEELRDEGVSDDVLTELEAFGGSSLRKQAARVPELEAELEKAQAENRALKDAPAREQAFQDYGIDLESLRPMERERLMELEAPAEGFTPEWVGQIAEKYDLPVEREGAGEEGETGEPGAAEQVRQATAPGQRSSKTTITPAETSEWSTEKFLRFKDQHPEAFESLKRGESVNGITFT